MKTYGRNAAGFSMREIVFTGLMTALVFVATYVPHIPIPLGYAHLGDAVIFLLAVLAPRRSVLFAGALARRWRTFSAALHCGRDRPSSSSSSWRRLSAVWGATALFRRDARGARRRFSSQAFGWRQAILSREPSSTTAWRRHLPPHRGSSLRASRTASLRSFWCLPFGSIFRGGDSGIFVKMAVCRAVLRRRQHLA